MTNNERRLWAIEWLETTIESGDYSDTYFKELSQLFAYDETHCLILARDELDGCNKALALAKFLIKEAGYKLIQQSIKSDAGYQFLKPHIRYEVDWTDPNNAFEKFTDLMRERSKQEQMSLEYYGQYYGYDYYLGRVHKNFMPPIPEELIEMVMQHTKLRRSQLTR